MPVSESLKIFLKNNREEIQKKYSDEQFRTIRSFFDDYSSYFEENSFFMTLVNVIKMKENVSERTEEAREEQKQEQKQEQKPTEDDDDDIKNLFE